MDITLDRKDLLAAVAPAASATAPSATLPILSHVLLRAAPPFLDVLGTDTDLAISVSAHLTDCQTPGACVVPARELLHIARTWPDQASIRIRWPDPDGPCLFTHDKLSYRLPALPPVDFPEPKALANEQTVILSPAALASLLTRVSHAMANHDVRHYLCGALLESTDRGLTAVATDGHRLALSDQAHDTEQSPDPITLPRTIIPNRTVREMIKHLPGWSQPCVLAIGGGYVHVRSAHMTIYSKLIDATYPDYQRVIPEDLTCLATVERVAITRSAKRLVGMLNDARGLRAGRLQFSRGLLLMDVRSHLTQVAGDEAIPCQADMDSSGPPEITIGLSLDYLLDALGALDADQIEIRFSGPNQAILLRSADDGRAIYVIMPCRV